MRITHIAKGRTLRDSTKTALCAVTKAARYAFVDPTELTHLFIACDEDKIVGFASVMCYHGYWCLRSCVVHPKWRGQGIQRELIHARIDFLTAKKAKHVNAWVAPSNVYSLNNLVAVGFRFVAEKPRVFNEVEHLKLRIML